MNQKPKRVKDKSNNRLFAAAAILSCIVLLLLAGNIYLSGHLSAPTESDQTGETALPEEQEETQASQSGTETPPEDATAEQDRTILPQLAEYYEKNQELAGWITIEGTELDYPFMYTPDDPQKYLHLDLDGNYSNNGTIFVDANCSLDPESDNLILHGHNMRDGSMFRTLLSYKDESFWEEHPVIRFSTLYEEREYEVLAVFYDRVYYADEDCFKFYQFIDAENEAEYNEAIAYYQENALYDTGVTAQYGDRLITLSTCSYHETNGRFVVVARECAE